MPTATPQTPAVLARTTKRLATFIKTIIQIMIIFFMIITCLVLLKEDMFRDLFILFRLIHKYGGCVWALVWIVLQFMAWLVSISSWKTALLLTCCVLVLIWIAWSCCVQCIAWTLTIARQTYKMLKIGGVFGLVVAFYIYIIKAKVVNESPQ